MTDLQIGFVYIQGIKVDLISFSPWFKSDLFVTHTDLEFHVILNSVYVFVGKSKLLFCHKIYFKR